MSPFAPLLVELDCWEAVGRTADLWLRDDDAVSVTPALEQLLECKRDPEIPLALAVIPMLASGELARRISDVPDVYAWQHGVTHENHAEPPAKKQELTGGPDEWVRPLRSGFARLQSLFGERAAPILVPPWNRITASLIPRLPETGLNGLSVFKPRHCKFAAPSVWQVNTHIDIIDWKRGRALRPVPDLYQQIADHLRARRCGAVDPAEPTGILTHHLVMDESAFAFLSGLFALTTSHPAASWCVPNSA